MSKVKLIILSVSVICLFALSGCQNQSTQQKNNTNKIKTTQTKNQSLMISVSISLVKWKTKPAMNFKVPSGWKKQNIGGGSTGGYVWVNPKNNHQKIRFLMSGTVGAMKNQKTGQWDVTGTVGRTGINWANVSSNKLTANFTESLENGKTVYGKATIIKSLPVAVSLEVFGMDGNFPKLILKTFHLLQ